MLVAVASLNPFHQNLKNRSFKLLILKDLTLESTAMPWRVEDKALLNKPIA